MISEKLKLLQIYALCLDILALVFSYTLSLGLMYGFHKSIVHTSQFKFILLFIPVYIAAYFFSDLYEYRTRITFYKTLENVCVANGTAVFLVAVLSFFFRYGDGISRIVFALMLFINIILTLVIRLLSLAAVNHLYESKIAVKAVILTIGNSKKNIPDKIKESTKVGYEIITVIEKKPDKGSSEDITAIVDEVSHMIKGGTLDEVILVTDVKYFQMAEDIVRRFEEIGTIVHLYIDVHIEGTLKKVNQYGDLVMLSVYKSKLSAFQLFQKRVLDIVGGLMGLILMFCISVVIAPLIVLESGFPILFSQIRVGENGRRFRCYKFRSMCIDAEARKNDLADQNEIKGNMFKITNDPRVTRIGKFIRKTSIDEFPQFFNVLVGDMSLVGTRPPTVDEVSAYDPHHMRRISMKPGITGEWQVNGRSAITDFEEVVRLDLQYIDNWSLWLDIKIILKTLLVIFQKTGAR